MANNPGAKKAIRKIAARTEVNKSRRTRVRTFLRKFQEAVTGGDAERLYERAGWQRVGVVPNFALMPDGAPCATTYFHKQLV